MAAPHGWWPTELPHARDLTELTLIQSPIESYPDYKQLSARHTDSSIQRVLLAHESSSFPHGHPMISNSHDPTPVWATTLSCLQGLLLRSSHTEPQARHVQAKKKYLSNLPGKKKEK